MEGMPKLERASLIVMKRPWVCQQCLRRRPNLDIQNLIRTIRTRGFSTSNSTSISSTRLGSLAPKKRAYRNRRRTLVFAAFLGVLSIAYTDTAQHGFLATKRSLRVAQALVLSVRESVVSILLLESMSKSWLISAI